MGRNFLERGQPFPANRILEGTEPRDVTVRVRKACNEAATDRVCHDHKHNRYGIGFPLKRRHCGSATGEDHVWFGCDQLSRLRPYAASIARPETVIDVDTTALHPSQFSKLLLEYRNARWYFWVCFSNRNQRADPPHVFGLLRERAERQCGCRAAEQRDELAPLHSITSSGQNCRVGKGALARSTRGQNRSRAVPTRPRYGRRFCP